MPNKVSSFWQELIRRNVVRVITVYAGAAFVILELVDIIAEPLKLPSWLLPVVIVLLSIGFIIAVILSWIYDVHPQGRIVKTESADNIIATAVPKSFKGWKISSYISFVAIVGLIVLNIFGGNRDTRIDESLEKSIAVLPFLNLVGDSEQEYMSLGLTNEIINHLYRIESFDIVRSLTSVMTYNTHDIKISQIAEELKVNYVLEGTYKKVGDQLRITAQLVDSRDEYIWIQDYDLLYKEVIGIPAEIALQIADHLKAFITDDEQQIINRMPTENLEAYKLLQEAIYTQLLKAPLGMSESIDLTRKAIELDPGYATAYAWAGIWTLYYGSFSGNREMFSVVWDAISYLEKALEIDKNNSTAHLGMAFIYDWVRWDYIKAENAYTKSIDLEPGNNPKYGWFVEFLLKMGRLDDAIKYTALQFSMEENSIWDNDAIQLNVLLGNLTEASSILQEYIAMVGERAYTKAGEYFIWLQEYDSAKHYLELSLYLKDQQILFPRFQACLALAYHKTDDFYNAQKTISGLIRRSDTTTVGNPAYFTGWYYSSIGEVDSAFYWLEKAYNNRSSELPWLKVDPAFTNLQDDNRYWDLYARTGHKAYDDYIARKKQ